MRRIPKCLPERCRGRHGTGGHVCLRHMHTTMKKAKRIAALIAAIALAGMYLVTLILGISGSDQTGTLLMASIICTVLVSVLFYAFFLVAKVLGRRGEEGKPDTSRHQGQ